MNGNMPSETGKNATCAVCKILAKQKCSGCKVVYYCSQEHQKADWKTHSKNCQVFMILKDSENGRECVATRNIKIGELVMCEKEPILLTPNPQINLACLSCYVPLTVESMKPCDICGLPLCVNCTKHGPECELTMRYYKPKLKFDELPELTQYLMSHDLIFLMRALTLRDKKPSAYKKLLRLENHSTKMMKECAIGLMPMKIIGLNYLVRELMKIDDLTVTEMMKIFGIVQVYGFDHYTAKNHKVTAIYDKASSFKHSCCSNCRTNSHSDVDNDGGSIFVRAVTMIPNGTPITINRYQGGLMNTVQRRDIMSKERYFSCTCDQCKDPSEFGMMLSAVKCIQENCIGYMLPPTFLVANDEKIPDFMCNKCNLTTPSATIDEILTDISVKFCQIDQDNMNQLQEFVDEQTKILHENHSFILNAEIRWVMLMKENHEVVKTLSVERLKANVMVCKKLLRLHEVLIPDHLQGRGSILDLKAAITIELAQRHRKQDPAQFSRYIKETIEMTDELTELLLNEPTNVDAATSGMLLRLMLEHIYNCRASQ